MCVWGGGVHLKDWFFRVWLFRGRDAAYLVTDGTVKQARFKSYTRATLHEWC